VPAAAAAAAAAVAEADAGAKPAAPWAVPAWGAAADESGDAAPPRRLLVDAWNEGGAELPEGEGARLLARLAQVLRMQEEAEEADAEELGSTSSSGGGGSSNCDGAGDWDSGPARALLGAQYPHHQRRQRHNAHGAPAAAMVMAQAAPGLKKPVAAGKQEPPSAVATSRPAASPPQQQRLQPLKVRPLAALAADPQLTLPQALELGMRGQGRPGGRVAAEGPLHRRRGPVLGVIDRRHGVVNPVNDVAAVNARGQPQGQILQDLAYLRDPAGALRVGVDLHRGGAIGEISSPRMPAPFKGINLVNAWDCGRLVQQSYYVRGRAARGVG
jgi:hypothetical protein